MKTDISLINLICTNLDYLGVKYPIYPGVLPDDGRIIMSYIDSSCSKMKVVRLGRGMKNKGRYLGLQKGVKTRSVDEFRLIPTSYRSPFCIDGDPHDVSEVHVKVLKKALRLHYLPEQDTSATGAMMEESARLPSLRRVPASLDTDAMDDATLDDSTMLPFKPSLDPINEPLEKQRRIGGGVHGVVSRASAVAFGEDTDAAEDTKAAKMWRRIKEDVSCGVFSHWDDIEMPMDESQPLFDYFDNFDDDEHDYGNFLQADHGRCMKEMVWSEKVLTKLANDKTARGDILRDAKEYGEGLPSRHIDGVETKLQDRHVTVIYNPKGGGGKAKTYVSKMVVPVLELAKLKFTVQPTKYRNHAVEILRDLNPERTDAVIVCGGDGLVHEAITGYFQNPQQDLIHKRVAIGIWCGSFSTCLG